MLSLLTFIAFAQLPVDTPTTTDPKQAEEPPALVFVKPDAELGVPLNDAKTVFLDKSGDRLWLKTVVVLRDAPLEMFLCRVGTKEHESVLAVKSPAFVIHGGLLAMGLQPGRPAHYEDPDDVSSDPLPVPPTGPKLALEVHWKDGERPRTVPAAHWVRKTTRRWFEQPLASDRATGIDLPLEMDIRYDREGERLLYFGTMAETDRKTLLSLSDGADFQTAVEGLHEESQPSGLKADWVFAGSAFITNPITEKRQYLAEPGTLICVANFGEAMIDVSVRSADTNGFLLYEPWTERVPPVGTPVLLEIKRAAMGDANAGADTATARPTDEAAD